MKLVPTTVEQKVPVRRLVECPGFQTVNESYVEYEDREAVREKEVWVKRIVPERYVERVSVHSCSSCTSHRIVRSELCCVIGWLSTDCISLSIDVNH